MEKLIQKLQARATGGGWYSALCPFHEDHHPSLAFDVTRFVCLSCGKKGSLDELIHHVETQADGAESR